MKRLVRLATIIAAAVAMSIPATASANTGDGGGGAPFTINNQYFIAYSCTYYGRFYHGDGGNLYQCTNGIYTRWNGKRYWGNICVAYPDGKAPIWYDGRC